IVAGNVIVGNVTALGTGLATVTSGAALDVLSDLGTIANNLDLSGTGIGNTGALLNSGINTFSGDVVLSNDTTIGGDILGSGTLSGVVSGSANLTKVGASTYTLANTN